MKSKRIVPILYIFLFVVLAISATALLLYLFDVQSGWILYTRVYLILLLAYTWFIFIHLFLSDYNEPTHPKYLGERISVIMPCYNETPSLLKRALKSVINAEGNKEIIIIDDGSDRKVEHILREFRKTAHLKIFRFPKNRGKREALFHAVTKLIEHSRYVVTIDSDTVLDRWALVRVVEPLRSPNIGAATGDVRLLNENQNILTRMVGAYYWMGLNIYKRSQSSIGNVVCCSGCLAAYRTTMLKKIMSRFIQQSFLGERCTHSEDRHLTNLILERHAKVVYVPEAISYTLTPSTLFGFLRQQQRWKRGFIRESLYTLTYAWKKRKRLFMQILFWDLTAPFFTFGLRVAALVLLVTQPLHFLFLVLPGWVSFIFVRHIFLFFQARTKILGLAVYALFYEVFLYWLNLYALFTVRDKRWITR